MKNKMHWRAIIEAVLVIAFIVFYVLLANCMQNPKVIEKDCPVDDCAHVEKECILSELCTKDVCATTAPVECPTATCETSLTLAETATCDRESKGGNECILKRNTQNGYVQFGSIVCRDTEYAYTNPTSGICECRVRECPI